VDRTDGPNLSKKKILLGRRRHGRAIWHRQTVPHCWPAKREWTVLIGLVRSEHCPVKDWSGPRSAPTLNSVFGLGWSGLVLDRITALIISKFWSEKHIILVVSSYEIASLLLLVEKPHTQFSKYPYSLMKHQFVFF